MPDFLWLAFERAPHPNAVVVAAGETDLRLVLDLFAMPVNERQRFASQFRNYVARLSESALLSGDSVICRLPNGVVHFVTWRLSKWLSHVLPAEDAVLERTAGRVRGWLSQRGVDVFRPHAPERTDGLL